MSASANQQALEPFSIPVSSPLATTLNPDWYAIERKWLKPLPLSICVISTHRIFGAIWPDLGLAFKKRHDKRRRNQRSGDEKRLKPLILSICVISTHRVFGAIWRDWGLALKKRRDKLKPLPLSICAISTHRVFGQLKAGGAA